MVWAENGQNDGKKAKFHFETKLMRTNWSLASIGKTETYEENPEGSLMRLFDYMAGS